MRQPQRIRAAWVLALLLLCAGCPGCSVLRDAGQAPGEPGRLAGSPTIDPIPQLRLEIKPKHFETLVAQPDAEVPARLQHGDRKLKLRLELAEHSIGALPGDQRAYRVVVRDGQAVLGLRRFTLRPPDRSREPRQPLLFEFLREQGVLAPRSRFVDLSLNGGEPERVVLEEAFTTELLERQQRREGVIMRFDDSGHDWRSASLESHRRGRIARSPTLTAQRDAGYQLLRGLAEQRLRPSYALDLETWARLLAACEIWSAPELTGWRNLRFYLNPFTLRIEPIAFAAGGEPSGASLFQCVGDGDSLTGQLIRDPLLRAAFLEQLHASARRVGSPEFASWLEQGEARIRAVLKDDLPDLPALSLAAMRERASRLLESSEASFDRRVTAASLVGGAPLLPETTLEQLLAKHPYIALQSPGWLTIAPGDVLVNGSLVLPRGLGLRIGPGTRLRFRAGELLLARGPLEFLATAEQPIVLEARDRSWSGVVQLGSAAPSRWRHVVVRRTEAPSRGPWQLTGGVTFRSSRVSLEDCNFEDSSAEDALNLVRSRVKLERVAVRRTASDAIDFDFCTGSAEQLQVQAAGGDGLDAAGSQLDFREALLEEIGDKAISVGEDSRIDADAVRGHGSGTAVASKDGSTARIENSAFEGVRVAGLMAYIKKPAYGPARLEAVGVSIEGPGRTAIAQLGSIITIDSVAVEPEAVDVDALYEAQAGTQ